MSEQNETRNTLRGECRFAHIERLFCLYGPSYIDQKLRGLQDSLTMWRADGPILEDYYVAFKSRSQGRVTDLVIFQSSVQSDVRS